MAASCSAVQSAASLLTVLLESLVLSSAAGVAGSKPSETSLNVYQTARRCMSEHSRPQIQTNIV